MAYWHYPDGRPAPPFKGRFDPSHLWPIVLVVAAGVLAAGTRDVKWPPGWLIYSAAFRVWQLVLLGVGAAAVGALTGYAVGRSIDP